MSAGNGRGRARAPYVIAAAALVVVLLVLFLPREADRVTAPPATTGAPMSGEGTRAPTGGPTGAPPALSSDMRENADRLFNRIMLAAEQGDQAQVEQFMPMAVRAYEMVEDLDDDGFYHLAILRHTAGQYEEARRAAQQILDRSPNHVLALGVAASAAAEAGDTAAAQALWERLLDAYPTEAEKPLPEYLDHQAMLEEYRSMAREATGRQ